MRRLLLALSLPLVLAMPVSGQEELALQGNRLYQENDFQGALDAYLRVFDSGLEAGDLDYNIGNAYFKVGDLARAILFYERAARIMPGDEDVIANLTLARSLTEDDIEPLPRFWLLSAWDWWVGLLPRAALILLVAGAYLAAGAGLTWSIVGRGRTARVAGRRFALVGGIVTLVFGLNLAVRELGLGAQERAVVMAAELGAQSAPSEDSNLTLFSIHEGTTVRIDRRSDGWAEIVLMDGRVGWVRTDGLETI
jgi:tetratricopeptide (TPR) repeat protein